MRKTSWRRIAFAAAALFAAAVVCLVAVLVASIVIDGQARQLPFIESGVAASLIREAQAQDPSAEITSGRTMASASQITACPGSSKATTTRPTRPPARWRASGSWT